LCFYFHKIWKRLDSDGGADLAALVSLYFVLSLFPFLLVVASLLGWIPTTERRDAIANWLITYFPNQARLMVLTNIMELSHGYASFLSIGLLATIWRPSSGLIGIETDTTLHELRDGGGA
jgi:membrane protein